MEIKVDRGLINQNQLALLQNFETSLKSKLLELVNSAKFRHMTIKFGCAVLDKKDSPFFVSHNASFGLKESYSFVNEVTDFLKLANLDIIIPKFTMQVDIIMSNAESIPESKDNSSKDSIKDAEPTFVPINPKYCFDQIILPQEIKNEIVDAVKLIEVKNLIYKDWGYGEIEPVAKSVLNMYGPAGTGKTMCAHAVAKRLNRKLLALNYSEIESKYLGEAAKNLKKAFETAMLTDSVLFFDEADSFLGKRVQNVTSSSDQALNSLRSQMLILLEEHEGVVLFATNLVTNFDPAFNSRIQKHIRFELPNKEARAAIIKKQIPPRLPLLSPISDDDFLKASEFAEGLSGREIKNAMLEMLLSKADINNKDVKFSADDIVSTMKKKKESLDKLEAERKQILKDKILKKMEEKIEEDNAVKEYEDKKKAEKEAENLKDNDAAAETTDIE